jgi:hypothetical protein
MQHAITLINFTEASEGIRLIELCAEAFLIPAPPRGVVIITLYTTATSYVSNGEGPFRSHIQLSIEPNTLTLNTARQTTVTVHPRLAILLLEQESAPAHPSTPQPSANPVRQDLSFLNGNFTLFYTDWLSAQDIFSAPHSHERHAAADFPGLEFMRPEPGPLFLRHALVSRLRLLQILMPARHSPSTNIQPSPPQTFLQHCWATHRICSSHISFRMQATMNPPSLRTNRLISAHVCWQHYSKHTRAHVSDVSGQSTALRHQLRP